MSTGLFLFVLLVVLVLANISLELIARWRVSDANRIEKKKGRPLATWCGSKEPALRMEHGVRRRVAKETPPHGGPHLASPYGFDSERSTQ